MKCLIWTERGVQAEIMWLFLFLFEEESEAQTRTDYRNEIVKKEDLKFSYSFIHMHEIY